MAVTFSYADVRLNYNQKQKLKGFIAHMAAREGYTLEQLNYVFCSDAFLLDINQRFLNHDDYTDIITFDLRENRKMSEIIGEIYISIDRVKDNALLHGVPFESELIRVTCHGMLHLCGYRDKKKADVIAMRAAEERCLSLYSSFQ